MDHPSPLMLYIAVALLVEVLTFWLAFDYGLLIAFAIASLFGTLSMILTALVIMGISDAEHL